APDCGSGGRWFESTQLYQINQRLILLSFSRVAPFWHRNFVGNGGVLCATLLRVMEQNFKIVHVAEVGDEVEAKNRYARALAAVTDWCRHNRHQPIPDQHAHLTAMMRGHYAYYGITGNFRRLRWYADQVE